MQIPIIPYRGQNKPWTSIPRINWNHPLATGLTIYIYDCGGQYVDLVGGEISTPGATRPTRGIYAKGSGTLYGTTDWAFLPPSAVATKLASTAPYSEAIATFYTGTPVNNSCIVGNTDATENQGFAFNASTTTGFIDGQFNNGANKITFARARATNAYQSWAVSLTSSTTGNMYSNGAFDKATTGTVTFALSVTSQIIFNSALVGSSAFGGGIVGFVPYYAAWSNRAITAGEAFILHNDPYCFLIYPEDEMFAKLVGTSATQIFEGSHHQPLSSIGRQVKIIGTG